MRFALIIPCMLVASLAAAKGAGSANAPEWIAGYPMPPTSSPAADHPSGTSVAPETEANACRDRIHNVRQERGLRRLEREDGAPKSYLIKAVDQRIDGCSVMVMHHDMNDVRPLPDVQSLPVRLIPIR
ncbi:hypothetical protein G7A66_09025 [Altererythrobacter sp. SALINAS58]|uniref:hypothetical protein n=1 Tax=Alteripontixanthobacter muriae TaxID=2705546 RepID=UPI001576B25A|nr:hypothetical protein [Alteripontixanthobacter muriae]NTZ43230.1 hypothetical protein [Alteripontixanthobacter muriae]